MTTAQMLTGIKNWVLGKLADINALIPSQASTTNQLADKAFVNSSIATSTATFRGTYNLVSDLSLTTEATQQQIAAAIAIEMEGLGITPDSNDYCFIQIPDDDSDPDVIARIDRYKYSTSAWEFEYTLNNSGFTAEQWAAINSGVTSGDMTKLRALPTSAELTTLLNGKVSLVDNGAYDVSANNGGITFASLSALLSSEDLDTLIPSAKRKGGMSIKFVLSSDNKYVQHRLMVDDFSTDVEDWEQAASAAKLEELEYNAVMTGSYDATVAVGLADNLRGDDIVSAEFFHRKTGGSHNVGSGIAAIKEIRGKSIVWNQLFKNGDFSDGTDFWFFDTSTGTMQVSGNILTLEWNSPATNNGIQSLSFVPQTHTYYLSALVKNNIDSDAREYFIGQPYGVQVISIFSANEKKRIRGLVTVTKTSGNGYSFCFGGHDSVQNSVNIEYLECIDLTQMFGAGNEPATAAEFEKMFPLDYYDYNAGEVIPFAGQNLVTTGKNQYNPATGKANLLGGQTYQLIGTYTSAEIDEVAVILDSNNCFTTIKDCVLDVTGGNDTDTFVGLYNGETNTYEPYERRSLPLDPSQWRDKQGNLVFPYGGMHGAGTAYDYAKVDADGYIRKVVRCDGSVDLGSLTWGYDEERNIFYTEGIRSYVKSRGKLICSKYTWADYSSSQVFKYAPDKSISVCGFNTTTGVCVKDIIYTDADTFKAAMQGVMLIYELETPVEVELATPVYAKYLVDKDGTEEVSPANGAAPYTTPANLSILYAMDARGTIANLPKNYLSKESVENMLNAMVSAGVIASYTMTWDAANNRYAFVITAPVEPETTPESEETND